MPRWFDICCAICPRSDAYLKANVVAVILYCSPSPELGDYRERCKAHVVKIECGVPKPQQWEPTIKTSLHDEIKKRLEAKVVDDVGPNSGPDSDLEAHEPEILSELGDVTEPDLGPDDVQEATDDEQPDIQQSDDESKFLMMLTDR